MKLRKSLSVFLLAALFLFATVFTASAAVVDQLTAALNSAGITDTGLIVEYLQKVNITQANANTVNSNVDTVKGLIGSATSASDLSSATKTQIANLMVDSAKLMQMNINFVDNNGNPISLSTYTTGGLKIQILDANGAVLAVADPKSGDLSKLTTVADSLKTASNQAVAYSASFAAERGGRLPNTSTQYGNMLLLGAVLIIFGAVSYKPMRNLVR